MTERLVLVMGACAALASLAALAGPEAEAPVYADRSDLLVLKEADGRTHPIRTRGDWERRRAQVLANMQKVMGPLPGTEKRVPLEVRVDKEERTEHFVRRKLTYASAPGERVPAYLLLPIDGKKKHPAVLALHQTVAVGKDEPVGLGQNVNRRYGMELAERGYVVLAPEYPTFGEHKIDPEAAGWQSGSMKAIWDNMRGLDLLKTLPEVDAKRIGCIGHSLGGHNTLFTSAFDTRIRALVSSCGYTAFPRYYGGNLAGWTSNKYMPRIKTLFPTPDQMPFDFHEVVAAIAPRAFLSISPLRDANFEVSGVRDVIAAAKPVYRLLGAEERLEVRYPDCEHDFPPAEREAAYQWLDRWLR